MEILMHNLFGHDAKRVAEGGQHDDFYESAFTYNTEREFANVYQSVDFERRKEEDRVNRESLTRHRQQQDGPTFSGIVELFCCLLSFLLVVCTFPFSLLFALKFIAEHERLVIFRMGRVRSVSKTGAVLVLPLVERAIRLDVRTNSIKIPALQIISSDKGIVEAEAVAFVQINDPVLAVCTVQDYEQVIRNIAYTTMYNCFVREMVSDLSRPATMAKILLKARETVNDFIRESGVEVIEITVSKMNVIKEGENHTVNLFQQIMTSEVGKQLMGALGSHAAEFLANQAAAKTLDNEEFLQNGGFTQMMNGAGATVHEPQGAPPADLQSNPRIDSLVGKIRECCDSTLVSRVGKSYRIHCESDGRVYVVDLNLRYGHGYCALVAPNSPPNAVDVTFALNYETLISLIRDEISPISAYINGSVRIAGSIEDAMPLKHLATRAKELNLSLT